MAIKTFTAGEVLTASDTNTFLANSGLVYVTSASFTGVTAAAPFNVTSCFSGTYTNYRLVLNITGGTINVGANLQLLSGTTPATGTDYRFASMGVQSNANANNDGSTVANSLQLTNLTQNALAGVAVDVYQPNKAQKTNFFGDWLYDDGGTLLYRRYGCIHNVASAYNGFRLLATSGSITGSIIIYGYREA